MGKKSSASLGRFILQIALGCMLTVGGIWALQNGGDFGATALRKMSDILGIVYGVIELVAGVLLILELFVGDKFGKFDNILMLIIMIVWIVAIVVGDFLNADFDPFLKWLYSLASHVIVLGAMWYLND